MIMLYNDDICEYVDNYKKDIIYNMKCDNIEINEKNIFEYARDDIDAYYNELRDALTFYDAMNENKIIALADLGLWYGRKKAQKVFNNLYDAVCACFEDINAFYFKKKNSTLTLRATHHDGENVIKFYALKNGKKYAIKYDDLINYF